MRSPFLLLFLVGCAAHRAGDAVASIDFDGPRGEPGLYNSLVRNPTKRALENAMTHPKPRWSSFLWPGIVEPAWLDRYALDTDGWRLEVWYANHGYFDARFLGWDVQGDAPKKRRLRPVHVTGHLDAGLPSRVRTVTVAGLDTLQRPLQRRIQAEVGLEKDAIFTVDAYTRSLDAIRTQLLDQSYAHASVAGDVAVNAEEHAVDVTITVNTGPPARFGAVTFEGLGNVPENVVRDQLDIVPGEAFRARALESTRSKLYALRVFGMVNVVPDLSDPDATVVPVRIEVSRIKTRELRAGPGFEAQSGLLSLYAEADVSDTNVFGRLWKMEQTAKAGVGWLVPTLADLPSEGLSVDKSEFAPIVDIQGSVELPHLFGPDWSLLNAGRFQMGLEPGYSYLTPSFSPTLVFKGVPRLQIAGGYRIKYFEYTFGDTLDLARLAAIEGTDTNATVYADGYLLSVLEQRITYDGRNDALETSRGWYWNLALGEAGGPFRGNYNFLRATGEVRAYRAIVRLGGVDPDLVLAGRLGAGVIVPYHFATDGDVDKATVPYAEAIFLGGSTSVRGWAANRLGPNVCIDEDSDPSTKCVEYPSGGLLDTFGNVEVRKGIGWGVSAVAFVDAGQVWAEPGDFDPRQLQYSVGLGARYATAIGPIRLDVGYRIGDSTYATTQPRFSFGLGLGEAF